MPMTKMPISNTLKVMDLCNNEKDLEAMRMCGLSPISDNIPEGETFIDRVVTVANSAVDMAPSNQEVLVNNSEKAKGPEGAVNDVVNGIQTMANDSIDESVSRIIDDINYFDKLITKVIIESEDGTKKKVPEYKDDIIKIEAYIKENYPKVYKYIVKKYMTEKGFNVVGVILLYKAYDICKEKGEVTIDDIKEVEAKIPSAIKKDKYAYMSKKLNESSFDDMDISAKYYFSSLNKCIKENSYSLSESYRGLFEDEEAEDQGAFDFLNKDNPETKLPENNDNEEKEENKNAFTGDVKELAEAIQEFISTIPERVKELTNKLSVAIAGKDVYVGLIVSAFVSSGALYLIYKTNKAKEEGNITVSECVNIFKDANYFIKKVYGFLDEDASNVESFKSESDYIKGAVNVAIELDSKGYKSEFFEKCVTNMATLYDNYLSDASKLK